MKRDEVHAAWAPDGGTWSSWVKPVLFACLPEDVEPRVLPSPEPWPASHLLAPLAPLTDVAALVDLPQGQGVWVGVALGAHGFRPIPLYNGMPHVDGFVDVRSISQALVDTSVGVGTLSLSAPPAFLLDDLRMTTHGARGGSGRLYDNRWIVRATDLPTATRLLAGGIRRIVLIQRSAKRHQLDLEPILLAWQRAGLELWRLVDGSSAPAARYGFKRLGWYDRFAEWLSRPAPRRRSDGAYGRFWVQGG